jgi:hypothetical protein
MLVRSADGDTEPTCTLYPWDRLGQAFRGNSSGLWTVYDEAGHPVRSNGRRVRALGLSMGFLADLARRAQRRAYRLAWLRGDLEIIEHYRFPFDLLVPVVCAVASAGLGLGLLLLALRMYLRPELFAGDQPFLHLFPCTIVALGGCLFSVMGYALGWPTLRTLLHSRVRTSRIDGEGIRVHHRDGTEQHGAWAELREIHWPKGPLRRLLFDGGTEIWLAQPGQRTVAAIQAIEGVLLPGNQREAEQKVRNSLIRCAVYWLLAAGLVPILLYSIRPDPGVWLAGPALALIPGLFYLQWRFLKFDKARLRRKYRRQRRSA